MSHFNVHYSGSKTCSGASKGRWYGGKGDQIPVNGDRVILDQFLPSSLCPFSLTGINDPLASPLLCVPYLQVPSRGGRKRNPRCDLGDCHLPKLQWELLIPQASAA